MVTEPGPLLASGRDADIFEFGPDKVLRRSRRGMPMDYEAMIMEHVASHGYPVPAIHELRAGGTELVMDRVHGPHLLDAVGGKPWRVYPLAGVLADLHHRLHALPAPPGAQVLDHNAESLVHLDLHPLNVIMSADGPVVIDWTNARRGHWAADVADAWLLLSSAEVPGSGARTQFIKRARSVFVRAFTKHFDKDAVRRRLAGAAERRARDHNMSDSEIANMRRVVARHGLS